MTFWRSWTREQKAWIGGFYAVAAVAVLVAWIASGLKAGSVFGGLLLISLWCLWMAER